MESTTKPNALLDAIAGAAPALMGYTTERLVGELWQRPALALRERCIVTVAALIATDASVGYPHYFNKALDSGVSPAEMSELMLHLAFYAGWPRAFGAVIALKKIFDARGIPADSLPKGESNAQLAAGGNAINATVAPSESEGTALSYFSKSLLADEIWRRPDLSPRERIFATVAAVAAMGQPGLLRSYGAYALRQGLTTSELHEVIGHVAFYGGWGQAIAAEEIIASLASSDS